MRCLRLGNLDGRLVRQNYKSKSKLPQQTQINLEESTSTVRIDIQNSFFQQIKKAVYLTFGCVCLLVLLYQVSYHVPADFDHSTSHGI